MNVIHVHMINQQNLIKLFPLLWTLIQSKNINNKNHFLHTYTFKMAWNQWFIKRIVTLNYIFKKINFDFYTTPICVQIHYVFH
jgi:hypothetical protein